MSSSHVSKRKGLDEKNKNGTDPKSIVIFCGCAQGLGDFSFGKKMAELLHSEYPNAKISVVTQPSDSPKGKQAKEGLIKFNANSKFPIQHLDYYEQTSPPPPDLLIIGPTLKHDYVHLDPKKNYVGRIVKSFETPIVLTSEYDLTNEHMEDLKKTLSEANYKRVLEMPTGLSGAGIFIDTSIADAKLDEKQLSITGKTILGDNSLFKYQASTSVLVNYSQMNAERVIAIHTMMASTEKNVDLIMMGEDPNKDDLKFLKSQSNSLLEKDFKNMPSTEQKSDQDVPREEPDKNDLKFLKNQINFLLKKGFSKIIYQEPGKPSLVLASSEKEGPTYRLIHTGRVSPSEAKMLRMLSGPMGGGGNRRSILQ